MQWGHNLAWLLDLILLSSHTLSPSLLLPSFFSPPLSLHPKMLPLSTNIKEAYKNGQDDEQNFIQNLALFLCTFLKEHAILIEQKVNRIMLQQ